MVITDRNRGWLTFSFNAVANFFVFIRYILRSFLHTFQIIFSIQISVRLFSVVLRAYNRLLSAKIVVSVFPFKIVGTFIDEICLNGRNRKACR